MVKAAKSRRLRKTEWSRGQGMLIEFYDESGTLEDGGVMSLTFLKIF